MISDYSGICTKAYGCTVQSLFLQSAGITTTSAPTPTSTPFDGCTSDLNCTAITQVCSFGTCIPAPYGDLADRTYGIQIEIPAMNCNGSIGTPVTQANWTLPGGANFCRSNIFSEPVWCYNDPTVVGVSSLSFYVPASLVPSSTAFNSKLYFGLTYADADHYAAVSVTLDGEFSFGGVLTPATRTVNAIGVTIGELGANITTGYHLIVVEMIRGSLLLKSIVLSANKPVSATVNNLLYPTSTIIYAKDYSKAYSPPGFIPNVNADSTFKGAKDTNFCTSPGTASFSYFCLNAPLDAKSGKVSYLLFTYN